MILGNAQSLTRVTVAMHDFEFSCCQDRDSMQIQRSHFCMSSGMQIQRSHFRMSGGRLKRTIDTITHHLVRSFSGSLEI